MRLFLFHSAGYTNDRSVLTMPPVDQEKPDTFSYAVGLCVGQNMQPTSHMTDTSEPILFVNNLQFEAIRWGTVSQIARNDAIRCVGPAIKFFVCECY